MNPISLPLYEPRLFVNRDREIRLFQDKVDQLRSPSPPTRRTLAFIGERGMGKSWLLQHLYAHLADIRKVNRFWLDLEQSRGMDPNLAIMQILRNFGETIVKSKEDFGASLTELSRTIMERTRQQMQNQALILFVDHVYEADWNLLSGLEDYFLGPLAIEPYSMIVLAGRGRPYPWKTPELKFMAEFIDLKPLTLSETTRQITLQVKKVAPERAEQVFATTEGNPLGNYLLSARPADEALQDFIEAILAVADPQSRSQLREYLESLCVLRAFDEERIPTMLAAYYRNRAYTGWRHAQARQVREQLVSTGFARWSDDKRAFVFDDLLRKSIERYLRSTQFEKWKNQHGAALQLYVDWRELYPRARKTWQEEVEYHKAALEAAGVDVEPYLTPKTDHIHA